VLNQVIRRISAFANDFFNLNGGYIVIGIEEENGVAKLPPHGLDQEKIDEIQKQIRGSCNRLKSRQMDLLLKTAPCRERTSVIWISIAA
jgi:ATP-dependent DNA helicase RecG